MATARQLITGMKTENAIIVVLLGLGIFWIIGAIFQATAITGPMGIGVTYMFLVIAAFSGLRLIGVVRTAHVGTGEVIVIFAFSVLMLLIAIGMRWVLPEVYQPSLETLAITLQSIVS